ncbi:hypothetical protein QQS21_010787 [Conoideocrella luteorostrata]|uniref:Uncharacterized protein n=1 Tax=Conoideocrella luteorostrata TaxID=1105319 RepID=A0AAJ0CFB3_9HYPO|nr:hypothetical protein QQS21_010787 [Conoideocrella luteorostrata]
MSSPTFGPVTVGTDKLPATVRGPWGSTVSAVDSQGLVGLGPNSLQVATFASAAESFTASNLRPQPVTFFGQNLTVWDKNSQIVTSTATSPSTTQSTNSGHASSPVSSGASNPTNSNSAFTTGTTTTSSSSIPPLATNDTSSNSSSDLSAGVVTGIAIGSAVVGLLAGLLAAWILLRRRGRHDNTSNTVVACHEPKGNAIDAAPTSDIQLSQFLLEATPDREIAQEVQSLGQLIRQHVESHYHSKSVNANTNTQGLSATLGTLGFPSLDARAVAGLCLDPTTRKSGLRHVIMRATFNSIDVHSRNGLPSMLPRPIASFLQAMPPDEQGGSDDAQDTATSMAFRKWRRLSAFLLHPDRSQRTRLPMDEPAVALQTQELAQSLHQFLGVFAARQQEQSSHLRDVIAECAKLGHILLSHPGDWAFVTSVTETRALVVEAGLDKLSERDGPPFARAQRVVEPVVDSYRSGN